MRTSLSLRLLSIGFLALTACTGSVVASNPGSHSQGVDGVDESADAGCGTGTSDDAGFTDDDASANYDGGVTDDDASYGDDGGFTQDASASFDGGWCGEDASASGDDASYGDDGGFTGDDGGYGDDAGDSDDGGTYGDDDGSVTETDGGDDASCSEDAALTHRRARVARR